MALNKPITAWNRWVAMWYQAQVPIGYIAVVRSISWELYPSVGSGLAFIDPDPVSGPFFYAWIGGVAINPKQAGDLQRQAGSTIPYLAQIPVPTKGGFEGLTIEVPPGQWITVAVVGGNLGLGTVNNTAHPMFELDGWLLPKGGREVPFVLANDCAHPCSNQVAPPPVAPPPSAPIVHAAMPPKAPAQVQGDVATACRAAIGQPGVSGSDPYGYKNLACVNAANSAMRSGQSWQQVLALINERVW